VFYFRQTPLFPDYKKVFLHISKPYLKQVEEVESTLVNTRVTVMDTEKKLVTAYCIYVPNNLRKTSPIFMKVAMVDTE
jgi:outer membrane lipopolysaccharide assembly protein LptE/RlpB